MSSTTIQRVAAIRGELDRGGLEAAVLAEHKLTLAEWRLLEEDVLVELADAVDRGNVEALNAYRTAYGAAPKESALAEVAFEGRPAMNVSAAQSQSQELEAEVLPQVAQASFQLKPAMAPIRPTSKTMPLDVSSLCAALLPFAGPDAQNCVPPDAEEQFDTTSEICLSEGPRSLPFSPKPQSREGSLVWQVRTSNEAADVEIRNHFWCWVKAQRVGPRSDA